LFVRVHTPRFDLQLLRPFPANPMTAVEVNPFVNDARHEGPQCVEPAADQPELFA
jgi:putative SOS response-associated peptidase YedK